MHQQLQLKGSKAANLQPFIQIVRLFYFLEGQVWILIKWAVFLVLNLFPTTPWPSNIEGMSFNLSLKKKQANSEEYLYSKIATIFQSNICCHERIGFINLSKILFSNFYLCAKAAKERMEMGIFIIILLEVLIKVFTFLDNQLLFTNYIFPFL